MGALNVDPEQGVEESKSQTQHEGTSKPTRSEPIAKRRKPQYLAIVFYIVVGVAMLVYSLIERRKTEYTELADFSENSIEAIKNGTRIVYVKGEEHTYPILFNIGVGLLSFILVTFFNRVILVIEEFRQFRSRYNRNIRKLLGSCLSGISWKGVVVLLLLGGALVYAGRKLGGKEPLHIEDAITFVCAIGVYPLFACLLNLNALADAEFSGMVEEKKLYPAYTLAWNYYFEVLQNLLPIVNDKLTENNVPFGDNENEDAKTDKNREHMVTLEKLILIVSHDCRTYENLEKLDPFNIVKLHDVEYNGYSIPLYNMKYGSKQYILPVLYATQPLKTLHQMSTHGRIECVSDENIEEQVKLFYNTLQNEILCKPLNEDFKEKCIVLPIKADQKRNLAKGGLVKLIIKWLKDDEDSGGSKHNQSFALPPSRSKTFSSLTKSFSLEKAIRLLPKEQSDDKNGRIENAKSISSIGKTSAQVHCPKQPTSHHTKQATKKMPKEDAMYTTAEEIENYDPYKKDEEQVLIKDRHKYDREEHKNVDTKQQKAIIQTYESSKNYNNHPFVSNLTEVEKGMLIQGEVQEIQYEDGKAKYQYPRPSVIMSTKQHCQQNANEFDEEDFNEDFRF